MLEGGEWPLNWGRDYNTSSGAFSAAALPSAERAAKRTSGMVQGCAMPFIPVERRAVLGAPITKSSRYGYIVGVSRLRGIKIVGRSHTGASQHIILIYLRSLFRATHHKIGAGHALPTLRCSTLWRECKVSPSLCHWVV